MSRLKVYDLATGSWVYAGGVNSVSLATDPEFSSRYVSRIGGVLLTDAAQTITTSLSTDITWGTEISDPDGWISGGGALLTVPTGKAGRYLVTYNGKWSAFPSSSTLACYINGVAEYEFTSTGGIVLAPTLTFMRTLVVGDTIRFAVFQSSGSNKDVTSRLEIAPA